MNKKTKALTTEQYKNIIQTMKEGVCGSRPNERIATALVLEGNLGLRISDILRLKLSDIVKDGDRYRLCITEQKTSKQREFTVPLVIQQYIENYCLRNGIKKMNCSFQFQKGQFRNSFRLSVMLLDMKASEPTVSASGTQRKSILRMVTTSH